MMKAKLKHILQLKTLEGVLKEAILQNYTIESLLYDIQKRIEKIEGMDKKE